MNEPKLTILASIDLLEDELYKLPKVEDRLKAQYLLTQILKNLNRIVEK